MSHAAPRLPALILATCDLVEAETCGLGATLLTWDGEALSQGAERRPMPNFVAQVVGAMALSPEGAAQLGGLDDAWGLETGLDALPIVDLSSMDRAARSEAAVRAFAQLLAPAFGDLARQNADLLADLARMRVAQEDLEIMARKQAMLIRSQSGGKRFLAQAHGPLDLAADAGFVLPPSARLLQRLKVASDGLTDVAIYLPEHGFPESGALTVRLSLCESGDVAGEWRIPARNLSHGWLRVALVTALGDDLQSVELDIAWDGAVPLRLGAGVHHPDPALCARVVQDGGETPQQQILAHRLWKYVPGCVAPLPVDAHVATPAVPGAGFYVDPTHLQQALEGDPEAPCLQFQPAIDALQVHPRPETLTAARLPSSLPPGVTEITARVGARAPICPPMEYALAVVPRHPLRPVADLVEEAMRQGLASDWMRREGDAEGEVTLYLPAPLEQTGDLLLVTRVPPGQGASYGWATFRDIRMSA